MNNGHHWMCFAFASLMLLSGLIRELIIRCAWKLTIWPKSFMLYFYNKRRCVSKNSFYMQQNTLVNLQKAVTPPKPLIHVSNWSYCVNE